MKVRSPFLLLIVLLPLLALLAFPLTASAHANLARSEPVASSANAVSPTEIRLWFTENPEPKYSEIKVYDANLQRYDQGALRPIPGDSLGLAIGVRELPQGVYTVAWKALSAVDGHETEGSFAFAVGNLPAPTAPVGTDDGSTQFAAPSPAQVVVKWLMILAATLLVGALGLRVLVWLPALRASARAEVAPGGAFDRAVARRLILLAGAAVVLLLLTTVVGMLLQLAKVTDRSVLAALSGSALGGFLFETREGNIWSARLLLPVVALMLLGPALAGAVRGEGRGQRAEGGGQAIEADEGPGTPVMPVYFGLALGLAYLLTISLISHAAANPFWVPFTVGMDWLHLLGTAVWIGGLGGLVLTVPLVRCLGPALRPVLSQVVSRFSNVAVVSVGVLTVTGLYSAWLRVGSFDALLPTTYGRTLLVKLVLFVGLVALGAFNFFWLKPRLAARAPKGGAKRQAAVAEYERTGSALLGHFRRAIWFEVALGVAVIFAVAILTANAPAREALAEARAPKRSQTVTAGDLKLTMSLSSLQPGNTTFDVLITEAKGGQPVTDASRVILRVTHAEMDMGESEATLTSQGNGHYVATESYLSMSGKWDVRAIIQRQNVADVDHTFEFPIGSSANLAAAAATSFTAPQLPQLNSLRGIGFIVLGVGLILTFFGVQLFRRGSGVGTALLMLVPTALVVGGYLVYNGAGNEPVFNRPAEPPNPVAADAASIADGRDLFATNCVVCHGATGQGDGPQSTTLNPRPVNFTLPHTAYHTDGYLFNIITNGSPGSAMPAWGQTFSEKQRWDLVNYLRQFNPLTANGATPPPVAAFPSASPANLPTVTPVAPPASPTPAPATPAGASAAPIASGAPAASSAPVAASSAPASAAPSAAPTGDGHLIHAFDGGIWSISPQGGQATNLTPDLSHDAYAGDPALSPDGTTLAYTIVVVPAPAAQPSGPPPPLPGSDIWLMDANGGNKRQIYKHDQPGVLVQSLFWAPDGKSLLYSYTAPVLGPDGRYISSLKELQRLDIASGAHSTVVKDGQDPGFSPAGGAASLAYVLVSPDTFVPSLWVAAPDGSQGRQLIGPEAQFLSISGPRFSPDGKTIIFAGSGGPNSPAQPPAQPQPSKPPGGSLPGRIVRWLVAPFFPESVAAHGPPADLWSISVDGSNLHRLTQLNGDDMLPAWSPDGHRIAFLTGLGLYIMNADGSGLVKVSDRGSYSSLIWSPR